MPSKPGRRARTRAIRPGRRRGTHVPANGEGKGSWLSNAQVGGNTTKRTIKEQFLWSSGVSAATPQVREQLGVMDQSQWIALGNATTDANWLHTLGGARVQLDGSGFTASLVDTVDIDFVVDYAATLTLVRGGVFSAQPNTISMMSQFDTMFLPHVPRHVMLPGVLVQCIQIVSTRLGRVQVPGLSAGTFIRDLQPGMGLIGQCSDAVLYRGGRYVVRMRFYLRYLYQPIAWTIETNLTNNTYRLASPLLEWERRWQLQVPSQTAWDRVGLGLDPMPNAYTFSIVPTYPRQFRLETSSGSPTNLSLDYAVLFDPNDDSEIERPLVGLVAQQRRRAVATLSAGGAAMQLDFWATQKCRVYFRIVDVDGALVSWPALRSTVLDVTAFQTIDPPTLVTATGVGFRTVESMTEWASRGSRREAAVGTLLSSVCDSEPEVAAAGSRLRIGQGQAPLVARDDPVVAALQRQSWVMPEAAPGATPP